MDKPRAVRVKAAFEKQKEKGLSVDDEELQHILQQQFPEHRQLLKKHFPNNTLPQALRQVDFGKTEIPLNEVYYMKKLMVLSESVCRLLIGTQVTGTGFVLFKHAILTNAHLFKNVIVNGYELSVPVVAQFNYEDPTFTQTPTCFDTYSYILNIDFNLDYAVLFLKDKPGQIIPPGLLKHFGPSPQSGEVCLIGHPGGDVKKLDLTFIIEKEKRLETAEQKLEPHDESNKALIIKKAQEQGIDEVMTSDQVITYDTFMFHGSSGSPLFDAQCRVVGLHSAGFVYGLTGKEDQSIIEFAHPTLDIFKDFISRVYWEDLLTEAHSNQYLDTILRETGQK